MGFTLFNGSKVTPHTIQHKRKNRKPHKSSTKIHYKVPFSLTSENKIAFTNLCKFSGGDITVSASKGVIVIGGTTTYDDDELTPL